MRNNKTLEVAAAEAAFAIRQAVCAWSREGHAFEPTEVVGYRVHVQVRCRKCGLEKK